MKHLLLCSAYGFTCSKYFKHFLQTSDPTHGLKFAAPSRVTERRRSSVSDYVGMELELDSEEAVILSTVSRARSARSLKNKIVKSFGAVGTTVGIATMKQPS